MKWNVGMKIAAGFALALAILVAIGAVSYQSTAKLTETAKWVAHTYQVLEKLEGVLSGMPRQERGATSSPGMRGIWSRIAMHR